MPSKEKGGDVSPGVPRLNVETVRRDADVCVLAVSGELSIDSAAPLGVRLGSALAVGRVVADVSGLRAADGPAVQVFPSALAALGGWPEIRLVLSPPGRTWPGRWTLGGCP